MSWLSADIWSSLIPKGSFTPSLWSKANTRTESVVCLFESSWQEKQAFKNSSFVTNMYYKRMFTKYLRKTKRQSRAFRFRICFWIMCWSFASLSALAFKLSRVPLVSRNKRWALGGINGGKSWFMLASVICITEKRSLISTNCYSLCAPRTLWFWDLTIVVAAICTLNKALSSKLRGTSILVFWFPIRH